MGKGVTKVILLCTLSNIREKYFSADESYIPFKESCEEEARKLYGDNWCTVRGLNFGDLLDLDAH